MIYGYARVSTKGQAKDGNSLEAQRKELTQAGAEVIYEDRFTGTKMDRPEFIKLHSQLKPGDTLIVTKLDRFARSIGQASQLITDLIEDGITINVLNLGILSNDSVSTLMRNVLLAFAQFERDMIVQRTQEGKEIAKANAEKNGESFKEGRPRKFTDAQLDAALRDLPNHTYSWIEREYKISKSTLIRYKKKKGLV